MSATPNIDDVFEQRLSYPDSGPRDRLARLVGLDDQKTRLLKVLSLLINPAGLAEWVKQHHPGADRLVDNVLRRPPLVVLEGDVGSGKTALAESIGDAVARQEKISITLYPLSLATRGQGHVGEMTKLLSAAFTLAIGDAKKQKASHGKARGGSILLVDEADAIAQSREAAQMHHEDRAGVNAFIRGIDQVSESRTPLAVILCTNRLGSLDPAVRRRAADILTFSRPNDEQRCDVLTQSFSSLKFTAPEISNLVVATGKVNGREYGFTFSDLTHRLIPGIVLDAYPSKPVSAARALEIAKGMTPTPPFRERES